MGVLSGMGASICSALLGTQAEARADRDTRTLSPLSETTATTAPAGTRTSPTRLPFATSWKTCSCLSDAVTAASARPKNKKQIPVNKINSFLTIQRYLIESWHLADDVNYFVARFSSKVSRCTNCENTVSEWQCQPLTRLYLGGGVAGPKPQQSHAVRARTGAVTFETIAPLVPSYRDKSGHRNVSPHPAMPPLLRHRRLTKVGPAASNAGRGMHIAENLTTGGDAPSLGTKNRHRRSQSTTIRDKKFPCSFPINGRLLIRIPRAPKTQPKPWPIGLSNRPHF